MELKDKNLSLKVGLVIAVIHLGLVSLILYALLSSGQSGIVLMGFLWIIDFFLVPLFSVLRPIIEEMPFMLGLTIKHGVLGTIGWFCISFLIAKLFDSSLRQKLASVNKIVKKIFLSIVIIFISVLYLKSDIGIFGRKILIDNTNSSLSSSLGRVVFSKRGDIYSVNLDGTDFKKLTTDPLQEWDPRYSLDGSKICFIRQKEKPYSYNGIFAMDADGKNQRQIVEAKNDVTNSHPSFSPDGKKVVFRQEDRTLEINIDGTGLIDLGPALSRPQYSADGKNIYGSYFRDSWKMDLNPLKKARVRMITVREIWKINMTTLGKTIVGELPMGSFQVTYSPDCKKMVFLDLEGKNKISLPYRYQVYIANIDGSNMQKLTADKGPKHQPTFTQDGQHIIFTHNRDIKIMNINGNNVRKIVAQ